MFYNVFYLSLAAFLLTRLIPNLSDGGAVRGFIFFSSVLLAPIAFWWLRKMDVHELVRALYVFALPASTLILLAWFAWAQFVIFQFWPYLLLHLIIFNVLVGLFYFAGPLTQPLHHYLLPVIVALFLALVFASYRELIAHKDYDAAEVKTVLQSDEFLLVQHNAYLPRWSLDADNIDWYEYYKRNNDQWRLNKKTSKLISDLSRSHGGIGSFKIQALEGNQLIVVHKGNLMSFNLTSGTGEALAARAVAKPAAQQANEIAQQELEHYNYLPLFMLPVHVLKSFIKAMTQSRLLGAHR